MAYSSLNYSTLKSCYSPSNARVHEGRRFAGHVNSRFDACRTPPRLGHRRIVGQPRLDARESCDQQDEDAADGVRGNLIKCLETAEGSSGRIGARQTRDYLKGAVAPWPFAMNGCPLGQELHQRPPRFPSLSW